MSRRVLVMLFGIVLVGAIWAVPIIANDFGGQLCAGPNSS